MRRVLEIGLRIAIPLLLVSPLQGCSVLGAAAGASIDTRAREFTGAERIVRLPVGTFIHLEMQDGSRMAGTLKSLTPADDTRPAGFVVQRNYTAAEEWVALERVRRVGTNSGPSYGNIGMVVGIATDALLLTMMNKD